LLLGGEEREGKGHFEGKEEKFGEFGGKRKSRRVVKV
jgi:hypothetical protein